MLRSKKGADFRILHIEDNPYDAELTEALLKVYLVCHITRVSTRAGLEDALEKTNPDFIISDSSLPGFDGFSALEIASKKCPGVPFIFCTGNVTPELKEKALAHGATDYISKDDLLALVSLINTL